MEMHVDEASEALSRVSLTGKLDIDGMHEIDQKFHSATAARGKPALVDVSGLEFIASLGMGMLIACARSLGRKGARMVLLGPRPGVEEALRAAGVDHGIPIVGSEAEAHRILSEPA